MKFPLVLASASSTRASLLKNAGLMPEIAPARIDEGSVKEACIAEGMSPRDVADALAELKAQKIAGKHPGALVLGCDQVLDHGGRILSKPDTPSELKTQLTELSGKTHKLHSAIVAFEEARPVWRHVGTVTLTMRPLSADFIDAYIERNWPGLSETVGGYKLEEEGSRLFTAVRGDYFEVLGLPLLPLLNWMVTRGLLPA